MSMLVSISGQWLRSMYL